MDVAAKLGIIVDANGARREIKLTTDELKHLANGGSEATATMKGLTGGMTEAGAAAANTTPKVSGLADSIARMRAAADRKLDLGLANQIAQLDPFRLRTEQGAVATTKLATSMDRMRTAGREKVDLGLASQIALLDPFQKGLGQVAEKSVIARLTTGRFANAIVDLGAHVAGAHPVIGKLVEILGGLSLGAVATVGIVAGIAAIGYAWNKLTEDIRKATAEQNKLVEQSMTDLRRRALGAGGSFADIATAAAGRISDLQQQRRDQVENPISREIMPGKRADIARSIDSEISQLRILMKDAERQIDLAKTKQFAESVTVPFDYAVQRGQSILGFYNDAIAAQRELNELAKSGNQETKQTAIQGLQQIQQILDHIRLQKMGLAERPSTTLGLPSQVAVPALQQTGSAIGGAFKQLSTMPVELVHQYENEIKDLEGTINHFQINAQAALKEHRDDWSATGQSIRQAAKDAQTYYDALQVARHPEQAANIGAGIRGAQRDNGAMTFVQSNEQYGAQLAAREAALKLPPVFDAVREHAIRHGEALRDLTNELAVVKQDFASVDNAVGSFKEGLLSAAKDFLSMISPAALGRGLLSGVVNTVSGYVQGLVSKAAEGIRHAVFGSTSEQRAAAAAQRDAQAALRLTLDALRANVRGDNLTEQIDAARQALIGLLKQINDALPGTKNEGERNRQRAEAQALERQQEQQIRQADAQRRKEASEDLKVRLLRAQGQDQAADALALANEQQREYNQAVKDGADAAYLAALVQVQAAEKTKAAMDSLQNAVRNAPSGFRPEDYGLGQTMPSGGGGFPTDWPAKPPKTTGGFPVNRYPTGGVPNGGTTIIVQAAAGAFQINGDDSPQAIARKAVKGIRDFAASSVGSNVPIASAMELMS